MHNRSALWHQGQHPYKHAVSEFSYVNQALPGVSNIESALNWILAVLYPNTKPAVATPADLPASGNSINDYRVVLDDGDGKAASYRWEKRDGEGSPSWHKIYDMDWGQDSILAAFQDQTQDLYVWANGRTQLDGAGNPITGVFAGQRIFGGNLTGQNLTLDANSADSTGYVQTNNTFRPVTDNSFDLGTSASKFSNIYINTAGFIGNLSFSSGSITDSSGAISFSNNNLSTTGSISGGAITGTSATIGSTLILGSGAIHDSGGSIAWSSNNFTGIGNISASGATISSFTISSGSLTSSTAAINFGSNNLVTTGTLQAGNSTFSQVTIGSMVLTNDTITASDTNGVLNIITNGAGYLHIQGQGALIDGSLNVTGNGTFTGTLQGGNLQFNNNAIKNTLTNGSITLFPAGTGSVFTTASFLPGTNASFDLGINGLLFRNLFLSGNINNGSTSISSATLQSLRGINTGVTTGMTIFWNGSQWLPSIPDTEVNHTLLSGLTTGDAGHTQFALLAGRSGGQTLQGGTGASENLIFESTSNATKGQIKLKDTTAPFATAVYSSGWTGVDLGSTSLFFNNIYTKGEYKGARLENFTTASLPASSSQNVGRVAWSTDENRIYADTGLAWVAVGTKKYLNDESFDGVQTTKTVTVSGSVSDARKAIWVLKDNANDYEQILCSIKTLNSTQVTITTSSALPAGSYRLIGIE